jgi:adenylate kinase
MILLMGLIGTGKSTQGHILAKRLKCPWISTGELLRANLTPFQKKQILAGKLVGDEEMYGIVENEFKKLGADKNEFILDGFPRTVAQTRWILDKIRSGKLKLTSVIYLQAQKEEMKKRLLNRGRADDTATTIAERFKKFDEETMPVLDYLHSEGIKVNEIDATPSVEDIVASVAKVLELD